MGYDLFLNKKAEKFFNKLDNSIKEQIAKGLEKLKTNPEIGKPLSGNLSGLRSLREGKFRIIYRIEKGKLLILVLEIGHRKSIYFQ